jgi:hypothetical protein
MPAVEGYTLALYCDNDTWPDDIHEFKEFPHEYVGMEAGSVHRNRARKDGWIIGKDRVLCPKCSGKTITKK